MPRLIPFRLAAVVRAGSRAVPVRRRERGRQGRLRRSPRRRQGRQGADRRDRCSTGTTRDQDQPPGQLLRRRHRRQRQVGDGQGRDRAGPARPGLQVDRLAAAAADHRCLRLRPRHLRRRRQQGQRQGLLVPEGQPQGRRRSAATRSSCKPGDEVLWDLAPSYPYPNELALEAPERARPGVPFEVRVFSYDEKGKRKPVAGAKVSGATGADRRRRPRHGHADAQPAVR